jgi:peptidoglycan/xylan/chitin deacetylase (PgdA/CDA1 family)
MGYTGIVGWHVDSCDWAFSKTGSVTSKQAKICGVASSNTSNFVRHVVSEVKRRQGGILLFHDIHVRTVANLEKIIVALKAEGFEFSNLDNPMWTKYFVK